MKGLAPDCQACWAKGVPGFCAADALYLSFEGEERRKSMGLYCCLESTHSMSRKEVLCRTAGHIGCREGVRKSQVSGGDQ